MKALELFLYGDNESKSKPNLLEEYKSIYLRRLHFYQHFHYTFHIFNTLNYKHNIIIDPCIPLAYKNFVVYYIK